jgi:hypothetical protein
MTTATEYKGPRVMVEPKDALLMDSNWIHGPSGQNGDAAPKTVLEISTVLMIRTTPILVGYETGVIGKVISLAFRVDVEHPKWRSYYFGT